ncbi:hypothetical protein PR202_gb27050 [Eleusine coracana subsp. coracana]|uniref:DNA polymerase delta subunit 3 n=1 Tax=Eleusine coracana subsp. coracana TaxID=191504 RepID=A0AAV5FSR1_ELECO|nr:hypothetical protein PR202_gb27050 [Eleusine coracana subsp. coracana]
MAAAVDQALLDLLPQIHALFSDPLRVISYKWLSRNFCVSSNDAKRLLQEFVNKHGTDLQVIYSVSGWLKNNPQNYCVKLTSGPNLKVIYGSVFLLTKQEFKDSCSIQIYSVQASIPKDTAVLWNPEFVQAEELFNQPFDKENCLRDNRFCGILNSFVKRTSSGKHVSSLPPKPINSAAAAALSKPSIIPKEQAQQENLPGPSIPKEVIGNKAEKNNSSALVKGSNDSVVKESSTSDHASKNKAQNGKAQPGNGGSLATMWGRASAKPKPPTTTNSTAAASVAATADAQICAKEKADANSSDDEQGVSYKRGSNGANNRKRRAVFDFSDDEEEENVISIASPESPAQLAPNPVAEASEDTKEYQKKLESKQDKPNSVKDCSKRMDSDIFSEHNAKSANTTNHSGITLKEKSTDPPMDDSKKDQTVAPASTSPKRRKVLKTRIDERGREVTEVVWEGEAAAGDKAEKNVGNADAGSRATLPSKPQPASNTDKSKASSKSAAGSKRPAKAGAKQGNIMSFFKKV